MSMADASRPARSVVLIQARGTSRTGRAGLAKAELGAGSARMPVPRYGAVLSAVWLYSAAHLSGSSDP